MTSASGFPVVMRWHKGIYGFSECMRLAASICAAQHHTVCSEKIIRGRTEDCGSPVLMYICSLSVSDVKCCEDLDDLKSLMHSMIP